MNGWANEEPEKIAETDDQHVSPLREDGQTHGTPASILSVTVGDGLCARAFRGRDSRWRKAAMREPVVEEAAGDCLAGLGEEARGRGGRRGDWSGWCGYDRWRERLAGRVAVAQAECA